MKIIDNANVLEVEVKDIAIGDCFKTPRSKGNELGYSMRSDTHSGLMKDKVPRDTIVLGLNLKTGQMRLFYYKRFVTPINAAVVIED